MKKGKSLKIAAVLIFSAFVIWLGCIYVYVGTYIFPIAPHWVTQLPPNPPKPKIRHGEFNFNLQYEINGENRNLKDTLVCDFDGFEVTQVGGPKNRVWRSYYENKQQNELFTFRNEPSDIVEIVLENTDNYKIILGMPQAAELMGDIERKTEVENEPCVKVYDVNERYYVYPDRCDEILSECGFEVLEWKCDKPIENEFKKTWW